jgi:hypothetical protein
MGPVEEPLYGLFKKYFGIFTKKVMNMHSTLTFSTFSFGEKGYLFFLYSILETLLV